MTIGKAIVEGVAAGIVGTAQDIIEHPVQTMLSLVIGEYILAYNVGKVLVEVGQIGVLALIDKNKAKQQLNDYLQPIVQVIKAIEKEEISLRDAIKGTTQFAAGFYAQSKLLGSLGKFYKGIEAKARAFINKNPLLSPEHYLATSEGLLLKTVDNINTYSSIESIIIWTRENRLVEFLRWHKEGLAVNNKQFSITDHFINSLKKSGRKDIMPNHVKNALKQPAVLGETAFTWMHIDPESGVRVFINEFNQLIGIQPGTFK